MLNRIRDIRKAKGLTLADLAAACDPPTTAQTIGRLETGMRQLSLAWMNRIAAALEIDPASLMRANNGRSGADRRRTWPERRRSAHHPARRADAERAGRRRWPRPDRAGGRRKAWANTVPAISSGCASSIPAATQSAINRDCLVPRPGGRFAFGRLIDSRDTLVGLLPPGAGQKQVVVDNPAWIAVAIDAGQAALTFAG